MSEPISLIDQQKMKLMMTVPVDWRRPHEGKPYDLYWSDSSQFGQLFPRPTEEQIADFYRVNDYYTHFNNSDQAEKTEQSPKFFAWLLRRLSWQIDHSVYITSDWFAERAGDKSQHILDIGCGNGELLSKMKTAGHTVVGMEPDPDAREKALERGLQVFDGTGERFPTEISEQRFDAVFMTHVMEHALEPMVVMQNIADVLKPGGRMIIEVPNNAAEGLKLAGVLWHWLDVPRHLNFFTPESLGKMCEMAGFKIQATEFRGFTRQFDTDWRQVEQKIYDRYIQEGVDPSTLLDRNSLSHSWKLLRKTYFAADRSKYDSVRVIAIKNG